MSEKQTNVPGFGPLGEVVGRGARADVHALGEGLVLKLYWAGTEPAEVAAEARDTAALHELGLPVPACYGTVTVEGRPGIVFERVTGPSLKDEILASPWRLGRHMRVMAELQAKLHAAPAPAGWASQRAALTRRLRAAKGLGEDVRAAALQALDNLPDGSCLCHGDFHPDNILCGSRGAVVIDWQDPSRGSATADVARSVLLVLNAPIYVQGAFDHARVWLLTRLAVRLYLGHYRRLRPLSLREVRIWLPVLAAARLPEGIAQEEAWLIRLARRLIRGGAARHPAR